jgi:NAD(P)-dependent dehydrogenase (short-subunit alcohol dehydrogenase family)
MDLQLQQLHVLITGGSKGIGLACAQLFLREGAHVSLVARDASRLAAVQNQLGQEHAGQVQHIHVHSADLRDAHQANSMVRAAQHLGGPIDVLVNCAGAARRTPPAELDPQAWLDAMQAKYFSYIHVMDPVIKLMAERGRGTIVNVVGMGGKVASPTHLPGGAANAALMLASAGLASAYASQGVRVNVVNPGLTLTERLHEGMAADARLQQITEEEALRRANQRLPMGRAAHPEEIANAVVFLASARASYINGAVLAMDGGLTPMVV